MASVNKVILVGNVGRDAEMKYTPGGTAVSKFTLATNERWTSKTGEKQERTEWHRVVVWGKQAEIANEYVKKGRQLYVEGSIQTSQWEDKSGQKRTTVEIKVDKFVLLGRAEGGGGGAPRSTTHSPEPQEEGPSAEGPYPEDDIPF